MRADLHRFIDAISPRTKRIELDMSLELSAVATIETDRVGDVGATFRRYSVSPADALQLACVDVAGWINAQEHRTGARIPTAYALPQLELAAALNACAAVLDLRAYNDDLTDAEMAARAGARAALARWGEP